MLFFSSWLIETLRDVSNDLSNRYPTFSCTFWSVQVSAPHKASLQMYQFSSLFLKFKFNVLVKRVFFLMKIAFFFRGNSEFNFPCTSCTIYYLLPTYLKYSTFCCSFWDVAICMGHGCLNIQLHGCVKTSKLSLITCPNPVAYKKFQAWNVTSCRKINILRRWEEPTVSVNKVDEETALGSMLLLHTGQNGAGRVLSGPVRCARQLLWTACVCSYP